MGNPAILSQTLAKPHATHPHSQICPLVLASSCRLPPVRFSIGSCDFWNSSSSALSEALQVADVMVGWGLTKVDMMCHLMVISNVQEVVRV